MPWPTLLDPFAYDAMASRDAQVRRGNNVFIPAELTRQPLRPLHHPLGPLGCHLYVSPYNPGAKTVAQELAGELDRLAGECSVRVEPYGTRRQTHTETPDTAHTLTHTQR